MDTRLGQAAGPERRPGGAGDRVRFGGRQTPDGYLFELTGGRLCLDLANTVDERRTEHPRELLPRYAVVLEWAVQAGAMTEAEAAALRTRAVRHPASASAALARLRALREALFAVFSAVARRRPVPAGVLARIGTALPAAFGARRLERRQGRFVWTVTAASRGHLDRVLWEAARSAADLLTSPDLDRVRQCEGTGCAWLFLDTSRNRTRRWCDMSVCGNRAKARRHRARAERGRTEEQGNGKVGKEGSREVGEEESRKVEK